MGVVTQIIDLDNSSTIHNDHMYTALEVEERGNHIILWVENREANRGTDSLQSFVKKGLTSISALSILLRLSEFAGTADLQRSMNEL